MDKRIKIAGISVLSIIAVVLIVTLTDVKHIFSDDSTTTQSGEDITKAIPENMTFGIPSDGFKLSSDIINNGESLSEILQKYGKGATAAYKLELCSKDVFSTRNFRAGNKYTAFIDTSSTNSQLHHLVYERNLKDYIVYSFHENDSISIKAKSKKVTIKREMKSGEISSSLWNAMIAQDMPASLAMELSDIYAWSVDFFGLQKGDKFTIIYDNEYIDSTSIGTGMIWGAIFNHHGKDFYAIPFKQNDKLSYWNREGNSLRKNFLKAPLKFSRVSSKFSPSRLHPILKIRRPHFGVDYAAPSGTPVYAIADGVITSRSYTRGGGNTIKIKHNSNMRSGYLHLKGFAKGIVNGKFVNQGELIGYVGSTGLSTGPHLDFRVWRGNTPIDPLKIPTMPTEPISDLAKNDFNYIKERILGELTSTIDASMFITDLTDISSNTQLATNDTIR